MGVCTLVPYRCGTTLKGNKQAFLKYKKLIKME